MPPHHGEGGPSIPKYVGAPQPRAEDDRLLTGRGTFVADIALEGMAHAAFVRSPYAHARIQAIDLAEAKRAPGVLAIFTAQDFGKKARPIPTGVVLRDADFRKPPRPALAGDRVRHIGEAVALVVAESPYAARDAADLVAVEYDPLPAVTEAEAAVKAGAPLLHEEAPGNRAFHWTRRWGDIDRAIAEADVVVSQRIVNQRLQPAPLEARAVLAAWEGERLTVWATAQNPHEHREFLADILRIPEAHIRVVSPDVGGGFGAKSPVYPEEVAVALAARELRRPVGWVESRMENFVGMTHGRDQVQHVDLAAMGDGTILGLRMRSHANLGAYLSLYAAFVPTAGFAPILSGCYRMRAVQADVTGVFTNTTPTDAYRGAGRPEAAYLVERMVDILARKLDLDPVAVRLRNFIRAEAFPYRTCTGLTYDSGDYARTLEIALKAIGYEAFRREQVRARADGRVLGIGLSAYVEMCGVGPGTGGTATVAVGEGGTVTVRSGAHPHGQGGETTIAQIVADILQVPFDGVRVLHGDTDEVPSGVGTYGSRTTAVEGATAAIAAREVVDKARRIAAKLLEARAEDVVLEDGSFHVKGARRPSKPWQALASSEKLEATTTFNPEALVFPFGAHACVAEVDPETGHVTIRKYVAVDDCGTVINPLLVEGQIHGGVLQGIAQALWEAAAYDEGGTLLTSSFLEYLMPTAAESPAIETHRTETPTTRNILGAKGVGEAGTIASAPAVVNAVVDALAPYGVVHADMPLTPEKVWRLVRGGPGRKDR